MRADEMPHHDVAPPSIVASRRSVAVAETVGRGEPHAAAKIASPSAVVGATWALAVAVIINVARTLVDAAGGDLKR